jgi:hypothetical protein
MNLLQQRFDIQLKKVELLFTKAKAEENPALWLFQNDLRTPMFMLQGLSRIYGDLISKKPFNKLKESFKELEDALGAIDYYNAFNNAFAKDKKIPLPIKQYFGVATKKHVDQLNKILIKEDWLTGKRIKKINAKLDEVVALDNKKEVAALKDFYTTQIEKLYSFCEKINYHFDNVEEDVHELRRRLRWLSIYPQALQGAIKLIPSKTTTTFVKKYLVKEIIHSPYNKLPISKEKIETLNLDTNSFLALSWTINALGKLKDTGLAVMALQEAIKETNAVEEATSLQQAYKLLGPKQLKIEALLKDAEKIAKAFFAEKHLQALLKK